MHQFFGRFSQAAFAVGLFCCLAGVSVTGVAGGHDGAVKLRYAVEKLGNARSAVLSSPGAEGTPHCVVLVHELGSWSRFNWPLFAPTAGLESVRFLARRLDVRPQRFLTRILREDGTEWQSEWLALDEDWREYRLQPGDFTLFRGGERETAGDLTFDRAIQFQVVPSSEGQGIGRLAVDQIRFLPNGPEFTADGDDLVPQLSPLEATGQRLADVVGRWHREEERLERRTRLARQWLRELQHLLETWRDPAVRQAILERMSTRTFAWQNQQIPRPAGFSEPAESGFRQRVASLANQPETPVLDFTEPVRISGESLYAAVHPPDPRLVNEEDGRPVLRHALAFTADKTRQTLFTTIELPQDIDVSGRALLARMRLTPVVLNDDYPFLLRLWTRAAGGRESWGDFRPDAIPGVEWSTVRFDLSEPLRGVRFDPTQVWRLSIRMENVPGAAADFELAIDRLALGWPPPEVQARTQILDEVASRLYAKRLALYSVRDATAQVERGLRSVPELWRLYADSFSVRVPRVTGGESVSAAGVLDGATTGDRAVRPHLLRTRTSLANGSVVLHVTCSDLSVTGLRAELYAYDGERVASAVASGASLTLSVPCPRLWQPGHPGLYRLDCAAFGGGGLRACDSREVGLHREDVLSSPVQATLRQALRVGWPDWSIQWNGRPYFPRMARYHWPEQEATELEGLRMLADLWVDGQRQYGFAQRRAWWDFCDRSGIVEFASQAPSYRSLSGWEDTPGFRDAYALRMRLVAQQCDRPCHVAMQVGNEVELSVWGSDLSGAFPGALYQPLDMVAELAGVEADPDSPIMYVRAGSFRQVPPLPHEEMCGINQYTGRYSGRIDEIDRNLAELAMEALFCDRPLLITEWNGPKYSWASSGIGGVTRRGAAYYLERYWRAMINTPGIAGSSEFTLNWVIAPFEDLTTQTREEAWKDRPEHHQFGGGYTADHVPSVGPDKAVRGPCFRSMRAFHGPLYLMASTPGQIHIVSAAGDGVAPRLAAALAACGKEVRSSTFGQAVDPAALDGHIIMLCPAGSALPAPAAALVAAGVIEGPGTTPTMREEPVVQSVLNPGRPECLLTVAMGATAEAAARGGEHLVQAAEDLRDLGRAEGAMGRILAVVDPSLVRTYSAYILEQASRGFAFGGDDTRTSLDAAELFDSQRGGLRPAWHDLRAVIIDTSREFSDAEAALLDRLVELGVDLVVSLPAYSASSFLRDRFPARVAGVSSLSGSFPVASALRAPLPLSDLGGADLEVIGAFRPDRAGSDALQVAEFADAPGAAVLAGAPDGAPTVLGWQRGDSRIVLFGVSFGEVARIHWQVTHAGKTHRLYDRDTACKLERVSRAVINACLLDAPAEAERPRLFLRIVPEKTLIQSGEPIRLSVTLTDVEGVPVAGQLMARSRTVVDGSAGASSPYVNVAAERPGHFALLCEAVNGLPAERLFEPVQSIPYCVPEACERAAVVSLQFKAYVRGFTPADGAAAFAVSLQ